MTEKTVPVATEEQQGNSRELTREQERFLSPPVDIYETADGLTVVADLPGVSKENVDVRVENGVLTIAGKVTHMSPGYSLYKEFELLNFYRQFELSDLVDQSRISANLKHGVLSVHLPKAEQAKPRQISINIE